MRRSLREQHADRAAAKTDQIVRSNIAQLQWGKSAGAAGGSGGGDGTGGTAFFIPRVSVFPAILNLEFQMCIRDGQVWGVDIGDSVWHPLGNLFTNLTGVVGT